MSNLTSVRKYLFKLKKYLPKILRPTKRPGSKQVEKLRKRDKDCPQPTALLVAYYGKNYHGLNYSWEVSTIEGEILKALHKVGVGPPLEGLIQHKVGLQRVSRTDKGVSAAGNIVLVKSNILEKVNSTLPSDISVIDFVRAPRDFVDHKSCKQRTYNYTIPTFAFAPLEETVTLGYRTNLDIIERVNEVLEKFWYSHSFHCFTMHRETLIKSPKRYIYEFECGLPFVRDGVEFCVIRIRGESFMMHQIRKMIGLTIAIVKGFCDIETIQLCYDEIKVDIPKAPGLGLMLEKLHFSPSDDLFDGTHLTKERKSTMQARLDDFRENRIRAEIMRTEIEELSMMRWLNVLFLHTYSVVNLDGRNGYRFSRLYKAYKMLQKDKVDGEESDKENENSGARVSSEVKELDSRYSEEDMGSIPESELETDIEVKETYEESVRTDAVDASVRKEKEVAKKIPSHTERGDADSEMKYRGQSSV